MNIGNIDYEKLRSDLMDYFGSAMFVGLPMAIVDLSDVEIASEDELIEIAKKNNFDLTEYQITGNNDRYFFWILRKDRKAAFKGNL